MSLAKGIEMGTNLRMSQVVAEVLPGVAGRRADRARTWPARWRRATRPPAWSRCPTRSWPSRVQALVHTRTFRTYMGTDVVGCEIAGATKNVMAIAAGHLRRAGPRATTRGPCSSPAAWPSWGGWVSRWAARCSPSAAWPAWATSWRRAPARKSRNRTVGFALGQGQSLDEIVGGMHMVAEGREERRTAGRPGPGPRGRDADRRAGRRPSSRGAARPPRRS